VLTVTDARGALLRGDRALEAIGSDVRRLAVLARAGRDTGARTAQIERVVTAAVQPVLRTVVKRGDARAVLGEGIASARGVAALLCAARGLDLPAFEEAARVASSDIPADSGEDAVIDALAQYLRVAGRTSTAHDVRRTLSSPELRA
jgi:hypothetical protein